MSFLPGMAGVAAMRGGQAAGYVANAVRLDGTNDFARRVGGLTGGADSKLITGSCFIRKQGADGAGERIVDSFDTLAGGNGNLSFRFDKSANDNIVIIGENSAGTSILNVASSTDSVEVADGWIHVYFSFDMNDTGKRHLLLNGVSDLSVTTYTNAAIDFTNADWSFGANADGTNKGQFDIADLWIAPGVYLDPATNLVKFYDGGKPVDLGSSGELPTGTAPLIYFSRRGADSADAFVTNKGTGGGFTLTGALDAAPTSPSD